MSSQSQDGNPVAPPNATLQSGGLVAFTWKALAAVPGKSLNGRVWTKPMLEATADKYTAKLLMVDHSMACKDAMGISQGGKYGVDKNSKGEDVEGLWVSGVGLTTGEMWAKLKGKGSVPGFIKGVSVGGDGEGQSDAKGDFVVTKFDPAELSLTPFPGIPAAEMVDLQQIMESVRTKMAHVIHVDPNCIVFSEVFSGVKLDRLYQRAQKFVGMLERGETVPPIVVFANGDTYEIHDGHARVVAFRQKAVRNIAAILMTKGKNESAPRGGEFTVSEINEKEEKNEMVKQTGNETEVTVQEAEKIYIAEQQKAAEKDKKGTPPSQASDAQSGSQASAPSASSSASAGSNGEAPSSSNSAPSSTPSASASEAKTPDSSSSEPSSSGNSSSNSSSSSSGSSSESSEDSQSSGGSSGSSGSSGGPLQAKFCSMCGGELKDGECGKCGMKVHLDQPAQEAKSAAVVVEGAKDDLTKQLMDLSKQRQDILNRMYPPNPKPDPKLQAQLFAIDAEIDAAQKALTKAINPSSSSSSSSSSGSSTEVKATSESQLPAKIAENNLDAVNSTPKWITDEAATPEKIAMLENLDTESLRASMKIAESQKNITKEAAIMTSPDSIAKWVPANATAPPTMGGHQTGGNEPSPVMNSVPTQPTQANAVPTKSVGSPAPNLAAAVAGANVETIGLEAKARELMQKYRKAGLNDKQAAMAAYTELLGLIK